MAMRIAVINQKGGVGKTATAYNLAYCLSKNVGRCLVVDLDPSANSTKGLTQQTEFHLTTSDLFIAKAPVSRVAIAPIEDNNNLWLIPSSIKLAMTQREIGNKLFRESLLADRLDDMSPLNDVTTIMDCSPTLGDLTINAIYAADFILIPISYEDDSLEGMSDLFQVIKEVKEDQHYDYKILRNGFDARKEVMKNYIEERLAQFSANRKVFQTVIRQCEDINKAKMERQPVNLYAPKSRGSLDYLSLMQEIKNG